MATSLEKNYFRLIIYSHSSTNRKNLAKISPVNFAITGLTGIDIYKINKTQKQTYSQRTCFQLQGGVNKTSTRQKLQLIHTETHTHTHV